MFKPWRGKDRWSPPLGDEIDDMPISRKTVVNVGIVVRR
jgi:hypothetical protein